MNSNIHTILASALLTLSLGLSLAPSLACTPKQGPVATFEGLWAEFDAMYGGFEIRGIDWDDVYDRYRPLVDDDMSDDELFAVITEMLAETDDGHVHLTVPGRTHWTANQIRRELIGDERFDLELVRSEYLLGEFSTDEEQAYTLGTLSSGFTYLQLPWISDQMPILDEARALAEDSGGLVLDLRHNGGGDFTWALEALSRWTATERPVFRSRTRNGPGREAFTAWFEWVIEGRGRELEFPIVVLIDRYTISAGERAVMALATFDTVTFVGEPTCGAIATAVGRELLNGWYMSVPTQEVLSNDGTTIEGVGFAPDEEVVNDPALMAVGVDEALERAVELLES